MGKILVALTLAIILAGCGTNKFATAVGPAGSDSIRFVERDLAGNIRNQTTAVLWNSGVLNLWTHGSPLKQSGYPYSFCTVPYDIVFTAVLPPSWTFADTIRSSGFSSRPDSTFAIDSASMACTINGDTLVGRAIVNYTCPCGSGSDTTNFRLERYVP